MTRIWNPPPSGVGRFNKLNLYNETSLTIPVVEKQKCPGCHYEMTAEKLLENVSSVKEDEIGIQCPIVTCPVCRTHFPWEQSCNC